MNVSRCILFYQNFNSYFLFAFAINCYHFDFLLFIVKEYLIIIHISIFLLIIKNYLLLTIIIHSYLDFITEYFLKFMH